VPLVRERVLEVQMLHAAGLQGPELDWKSPVDKMACNPYTMVRYKHELCVGKTVRSSRNPVFHDKFSFHLSLEGELGEVRIEVFNKEKEGQPSTFIREARIELDALNLEARQSQEHWLNLGGGGLLGFTYTR